MTGGADRCWGREGINGGALNIYVYTRRSVLSFTLSGEATFRCEQWLTQRLRISCRAEYEQLRVASCGWVIRINLQSTRDVTEEEEERIEEPGDGEEKL